MKKPLLTGATLAVGFGVGFVIGAASVVRQYETGRLDLERKFRDIFKAAGGV